MPGFHPSVSLMKNIFVLASLVLLSSRASSQDAALEVRKQAGQTVYMTVCFASHQPTGMGLSGVKSPKLKKEGKPAVTRFEVESASDQLTKAAAIQSLGASASSYSIISFKRASS